MIHEKPHQNFQTLQCGRALAAISVLLFHANLTLALPKYLGSETSRLFSSGFSGVYYFFVLSGTVITLAHWQQIGKHSPLKDFLLKRFIRVYLPLWATLIIVVPLLFHRLSFTDIILAFTALPASTENILAIEWTLRHEALFYAFAGVLLWKPRSGIIIFVAWCAGSLIPLQVPAPFPISFIFSPLHLLFVLGAFGALLINSGVSAPLPFAGAGIAMFLASWMWQAFDNPSNSFWPTLLYGTGSLLMIVGFAGLEQSQRLAAPKFLLRLGDASYSLYLIHFPVVSACCIFARRFNETYVRLPNFIYLAFTSMVAVGAGLIFHQLVEVPLVKFGKHWLYGTKAKKRLLIQ